MNFYIIQDWTDEKYYICKGICETKKIISKLKRKSIYDYTILLVTETKYIEEDDNIELEF